MRKEVAKKWVKALRSGKYKQGQNFLKQYNNKNEPRYCCLGVLCELYNETMKKNHKKKLTVKYDYEDPKYSFDRFDGYDGFLPPVVKKWAGMKSKDGKISNNSCNYQILALADMNDFGSSFKTISNVIEKNVENL